MKRLLCFCMMCTLLLGMTANVHAETKDSTETIHYEYPIVLGTEAWSELTTHQQMIEAVQIPEDILSDRRRCKRQIGVPGYTPYGVYRP